jgi:hypothetical protein
MSPPRVVLLVPRRQDHGHRDDLWRWVRARWLSTHPRWPIVEGHHDGTGPFNRSRAINRAAADAGEWDVAVIGDSDSFVSKRQLVAAVDLARRARTITLAYNAYRYLTEPMTRQILAGYRGDWTAGVDETVRDSCSAMVVVTRDTWWKVGGFDERFVGWGFEDVGFSLACQSLCGPIERVEGDVWHLWHDRTGAAHELPTWQANNSLFLRYAAITDSDAMQQLLDERTQAP